MNLIRKFSILFCIFILVVFQQGFASVINEIPKRPSNSFVYDENKLLSAQEVQLFNELSDSLHNKTNSNIACVIVNDVGEVSYKEYAKQVAQSWRIGGESDSGILLFVAVKQQKKSVNIGGQIQDILPESQVEKLQQKTIVKNFRTKNYSEGILEFSFKIAQKIAEGKGIELHLKEDRFKKNEGNAASMVLFFLFVFFVVVGIKASGQNRDWISSFFKGLFHRKGSKNTEEKLDLEGHGGFGGNFGGYRGTGFGGGFGGSFNNSDFGNSRKKW